MRGLAGTGRYAGRQPAVFGRQIWTTDSGGAGALELMHQMRQPIWISEAIRIGIGDDFTGRGIESDVPRRAQSAVFLMNRAHARKAFKDLSRVVSRAIIDDNDFIIWIVECQQRTQALA